MEIETQQRFECDRCKNELVHTGFEIQSRNDHTWSMTGTGPMFVSIVKKGHLYFDDEGKRLADLCKSCRDSFMQWINDGTTP